MVQITTTNSLTTWFLILLYTILVIREIASQPKAHGASSARLHACLLSSASSALSAHLPVSTPVFFSALVWTGCRKLRCRGRGTSFNTFSKPYRAATLLQPTVLRVARSRQIARRMQIRCSGHRPRCLAAVRRQKTADQVSCRQVLQWLR